MATALRAQFPAVCNGMLQGAPRADTARNGEKRLVLISYMGDVRTVHSRCTDGTLPMYEWYIGHVRNRYAAHVRVVIEVFRNYSVVIFALSRFLLIFVACS